MRQQHYFFIFVTLGLFGLFLINSIIARAQSGDISVTAVVAGCGNGIIEGAEQCDGGALGGQTCQSRGFTSGTLSCGASCIFDTSSCTTSGGGGGGGGGGGTVTNPSSASAIFSGRAYPGSEVTLLKDGQISAQTIAGLDARFSITLSNLSAGSYNFVIYSEDEQSNRSSLFAYPIYLSAGASTRISGIFLSPTIAVDKKEVKLGDVITIFGQTTPEATVTININSEHNIFKDVQSSKSGVYLYNFNTAVLERGDHNARSRSAKDNEISPYGISVNFKVGDLNIDQDPSTSKTKGDANGDSRINLVDFSIVAYWYKRSNPPATADLNGDKKVDLVDFSIMAFNWTG